MKEQEKEDQVIKKENLTFFQMWVYQHSKDSI